MPCHTVLSRALVPVATLLLCLGSVSANAQAVHRCTDTNGRAFWSDKPCAGSGSTRITGYGPAPTRDSRTSYDAPLQKAPEHLQYLSAECASLNDALRTSAARGVGQSTRRELYEEYVRKCRDDDFEARKRMQDDEQKRRIESREQRVAQQREREQDVASNEQCREMGRIAAERRKKADTMTAGERADFERFQANFNERCRGR